MSRGRVRRQSTRKRWRVKLRPISISSRSILRRPSAMLIRQNGIKIAVSTKITAKLPGSNQIAARIAQPIEGNELSTGLIRRSQPRSSEGTPWAKKGGRPPMGRGSEIKNRPRHVEVRASCRKLSVANSVSRRPATASGPGRMNSGRWRADAHQASRAIATTVSPRNLSAKTKVMEVRSAGIVMRHARLQRSQYILVDAVHEGDDQ